MIGSTIGRYQVVARLGEGGMATVWRARDPLLGRDVALKLLAPALVQSAEARRRFRREAEVAQLLDHPAIVPVLDSDENPAQAWLAMALVEGETLAERMTRGLLPLDECRRIAALVASALGYAHARGVLHRDVSPRNVMLARDGRVYLVDFGLARIEGASRVTRTGTTPGTLVYMAPEVLCGSEPDPRSDLYSLGVVLYEMVTGAPPHRDDTPEAVIHAKLNRPARPASALRQGVPAALDRLLSRALDREPLARPADAEEFMAALRASDADPAQPEPLAARSAGELLARGEGVVYLGVPAFDVQVGDEDSLRALAASLAGALRRRLGSMRRLHVLQCDEPVLDDGDVLSWARRHGANLVLLGRVRRQGAHVRVECTLADPAGGVSLAGDMVEGSRFDELELEDRLVGGVRQLFPVLHEQLEAPRPAGPAMTAADDRFAQAQRYLQRHDHEPSVDAAMGLLERLVASSPERADIHAALAQAYLHKYALTRQHVWESRAASAVDRAVQLAPGSAAVRLALADLKAATGRGDEAAELYRMALAQAPERFDGWLGLARLHASHGRFEDAETACRQAISLRPRDWRGYSTMGSVYYRAGRYALAVGPWRRVLRLSPENARAAGNLAVALFHLDRFEESETEFRRSLALEPAAATYANLGTALYVQHRFEDALAAFERACDLRPADPRFWGYFGAAARQVPGAGERSRQAYERAIGLMRESLERNPEDAESWATFGAWLAARGQRTEARAAIERALELAPGNVACRIEAAHAFTSLGEHDRAIDEVELALRAGHGARELERRVDLDPLRAHERFRRLIADARGRGGARDAPSLHRDAPAA